MRLPSFTLGLLTIAATSATAQPPKIQELANQNSFGRPSAAPAKISMKSTASASKPVEAPAPKKQEGAGKSLTGGGKTPPPMIEAAPEPFQLTLIAGWSHRYEYKHMDQIYFATAADDSTDSMWQIKAIAQYENFGFSASFIQSLEEHRWTNSGGDQAYYQELTFGVNYSEAIAKDFTASIGYQATLFPEDGFWNGNYQGEAQIRLRYTAIEHLQPSISYSNNHGNIRYAGDFIEARVDSPWVLYHDGDFEVGVNFSAEVAYDGGIDDGVNSSDRGWAGTVLRAGVPIQFSKALTLTLSGNYGWDIEAKSENHSRIGQIGFWGGATVSYRF